MCRHVCPVGRITKREANTPHGWALLLASVDRGQMQWDSDSIDTLYECADCGLCQSFCVTDQPLPWAIVSARTDLAARGAAPESVVNLESKLKRWSNPYAEVAPPLATSVTPTVLFVGAAAQYLRPQTLVAARKLLDTLGIQHSLIGVGRSSAYLPHTLGLRQTAIELAQATLSEIRASGCQRVVVLSPEDMHTFTTVHAQLDLKLPDGVEVIELMTLIAEALTRLTIKPLAQTLTYHDPAHTARMPERAHTVRQVLATLSQQPLRELFWREQRAAPGGTAGGLEFTHPHLAHQMTQERLTEAASTGADLFVTEDPLALAHLSAHANGSIRIEGLYELLVQQIS